MSGDRPLRRLALILRPMPPVFRDDAGTGETLRAYYYGRLWRGWDASQRAAAVALGRLTMPLPTNDLTRQARHLGFRRRNLLEIEARRLPDAALDHFLDQDERKGLHAIVNHAALPLDRNPLKNKALFEARCTGAGLPIPVAISDATAARHFPSLISKPGMGSKGKGVLRMVRQPDGDWQSSDGALSVRADQLVDWIAKERARGRIVQQCMVAHASLADLSPGALPTLRVVTMRDEAGTFEVVDTALRLSLAAERAADNFSMDNLVAPVGSDSRIGPALRRSGEGFSEHARHPVTDAPIAGAYLDQWNAACALARAAHAHFADHVIIGWDIGLTAEGPVLIEGNWNPGYNVLQLVGGRGLGQLRMGTLYRHHLQHAPDAAWRRAAPIQVAQWPVRVGG
ncbi:MAG: hypothetical protein DI547_08800 [Sphingobium sp.]|nr:MAG: hypothetical protein DI547_08800 [Sphingobium sp.]